MEARIGTSLRSVFTKRLKLRGKNGTFCKIPMEPSLTYKTLCELRKSRINWLKKRRKILICRELTLVSRTLVWSTRSLHTWTKKRRRSPWMFRRSTMLRRLRTRGDCFRLLLGRSRGRHSSLCRTKVFLLSKPWCEQAPSPTRQMSIYTSS